MTRPAPPPTDLLVGLGGAVMLGVCLLAAAGGVGGWVAGGLAAAGLLLRWGAAPPLVLLATAYFSVFPDGLPVGDLGGADGTGPTLLHLLTAGAALVYAAGHYRHLHRAGEDGPADDLPRLFAGAAAAVLGGTVLLVLATRVRPDYDRGPLRFVRVDPWFPDGDVFLNRFVLLAGLLGGLALLAGLGLWLARLNRLTPDEARQLLLDTRWRETRRELARLETWRAAALQKQARPRRRLGVFGCLAAVVVFVLSGCVVSRLLW